MKKFIIAVLFILSGCVGSPSPSGAQLSTNPSDNITTLSWEAPTTNTDGTSLINLTQYKIYYSQNLSDLTNSKPLVIAPYTTAEIDNLASGTWYFTVTAVNSFGKESSPSNIASKTY
jgi:hypothetical protein